MLITLVEFLNYIKLFFDLPFLNPKDINNCFIEYVVVVQLILCFYIEQVCT